MGERIQQMVVRMRFLISRMNLLTQIYKDYFITRQPRAMALRPSTVSMTSCRGRLTDLKLYCYGNREKYNKTGEPINGHWTAWTGWSNCAPYQVTRTRFRTCASRPGRVNDWRYDCFDENGLTGVDDFLETEDCPMYESESYSDYSSDCNGPSCDDYSSHDDYESTSALPPLEPITESLDVTTENYFETNSSIDSSYNSYEV